MVREVDHYKNQPVCTKKDPIHCHLELLGHSLYMSNWVVLDGNKLVKGGPS